jgi:predicted transcriptional regulator
MGAVLKRGLNYSHDACVDTIIANPGITQNELASLYGYTPAWISQVINSDAFKERLAARKEEVVDPRLRMALDERIRGVVDTSLEVIINKLSETQNLNAAIRALDIGTRALGYGARPQTAINVQTNYVAVVPPRSASSAEWAQDHAPDAAPQVIDMEPKK